MEISVRDEDVSYVRKYVSLDRLDLALKMLSCGRSPQYVVGNVNFYGYVFYVDERVLIPRFETELLVEKLIDRIRKMDFSQKVSILDIGTGSGCIAVTLASEVDSEVMGVDISCGALEVARENAEINGVDIAFRQSDLFSNVRGKFDIIVSNPPYIGEDEEVEEIVARNEPSVALYAKNRGLEFYEKILREAKGYLKERFLIGFEIGCLQAEDVAMLSRKYLGEVEDKIDKDYAGRDRFAFISSG